MHRVICPRVLREVGLVSLKHWYPPQDRLGLEACDDAGWLQASLTTGSQSVG
jgi:hypothetical protein